MMCLCVSQSIMKLRACLENSARVFVIKLPQECVNAPQCALLDNSVQQPNCDNAPQMVSWGNSVQD
jgi:hypothetical protein